MIMSHFPSTSSSNELKPTSVGASVASTGLLLGKQQPPSTTTTTFLLATNGSTNKSSGESPQSSSSLASSSSNSSSSSSSPTLLNSSVLSSASASSSASTSHSSHSSLPSISSSTSLFQLSEPFKFIHGLLPNQLVAKLVSSSVAFSAKSGASGLRDDQIYKFEAPVAVAASSLATASPAPAIVDVEQRKLLGSASTSSSSNSNNFEMTDSTNVFRNNSNGSSASTGVGGSSMPEPLSIINKNVAMDTSTVDGDDEERLKKRSHLIIAEQAPHAVYKSVRAPHRTGEDKKSDAVVINSTRNHPYNNSIRPRVAAVSARADQQNKAPESTNGGSAGGPSGGGGVHVSPQRNSSSNAILAHFQSISDTFKSIFVRPRDCKRIDASSLLNKKKVHSKNVDDGLDVMADAGVNLTNLYTERGAAPVSSRAAVAAAKEAKSPGPAAGVLNILKQCDPRELRMNASVDELLRKFRTDNDILSRTILSSTSHQLHAAGKSGHPSQQYQQSQQQQQQQTRGGQLIKSPGSTSSGGQSVAKWTCMVCLSKHADKTAICSICGSSKPPTSTSPSSSLSSTTSSTMTPIVFSKYSSHTSASASTSPSNQLFASSLTSSLTGSSSLLGAGAELGLKHKLNQPLQITTQLLLGETSKIGGGALLSSPAMSSPNRYLKTWTCVHCQFCNDSLKVVCMNCRWPKSKSTATKQLNLDVTSKSDEAPASDESAAKRSKLSSLSEGAITKPAESKAPGSAESSICSSCKSPMRQPPEPETQQQQPPKPTLSFVPFGTAVSEAKSPQQPVSEAPKPSLSQLFGATAGGAKWTCNDCLSSNPDKLDKCPCCNAAKPAPKGQEVKKPVEVSKPAAETPANSLSALFASKNASKWDCSTCLSKNDADKSVCACCQTPKPDAAAAPKPAAAPSLSASLAGLSSGKWECSTCLTRNDADKDKCVACTADKPGAEPSSKKTTSLPTLATNSAANLLNQPLAGASSTIKFGTTTSSSFSGPISFGTTSLSTSSSSASSTASGSLFGATAKTEIKFGAPTLSTESKPAAQEGSTAPVFKFGASTTSSTISFGAPAAATPAASLFGSSSTIVSTSTLDFSAKPAQESAKPASEPPKLMFGSSTFGAATSSATTSSSSSTAPAISVTSTTTTLPFTFGTTAPKPAEAKTDEPAPKFSIGAASTTATFTFGSTSASTQPAAPAANATPSLFGASSTSTSAAAPTTSFFGGFGAKPAETSSTTTTTLSGSTSIFGGLSSAASSSATEAPKPSLFGASTASTSLFGSSAPASTTAAAPSQPAASSSFFGAPKPSIFGGLGASTSQPAASTPAPSLFGSTESKPSLFGASTGGSSLPTPQLSLFGASSTSSSAPGTAASGIPPSLSFPISQSSGGTGASTPFKPSPFGLPSTPSANPASGGGFMGAGAAATVPQQSLAPSGSSSGFNFSLNSTPNTQAQGFNFQPNLNLNFTSNTPTPGGIIQFSAGGAPESTPEPRKYRKATRRR